MRIAIVNEFVDPRRGGAETSVGQMALRLAEAGADVSVVASDEAPLPTHPRLRSVTIPSPAGPRWMRTLGFRRAAPRWCKSQQIEIVHAVTPCEGCDVYQPRGGTYQATVEQGLALIANPLVRGAKRVGRWLNLRQQMLAQVERRMLRAARPPHVAAVSELVARQVRRLAPQIPSERLHIVFNAVDVNPGRDWTPVGQQAARAELGLPNGPPIILFVAHNFRLKGLAELISALAEPVLRQLGVELAVVGRDRPGAMAARARRLGVASRVRFIGPSQTMETWFTASDVLAHPTWYDPCSRVVLEALCHGLPVVTTRCNGAAEVVGRQSGRVVESPRDTNALADAVVQCLDPALRSSAVFEAAQTRERLSMRRHVAELLELYAQVLPAKNQAGAIRAGH